MKRSHNIIGVTLTSVGQPTSYTIPEVWLAKRHLSWVQCLVFCIGAKRNISCFESELTDSWPTRRQEGWDCPPIGLRIFCLCRENILLHLSLSWKYFVAFVFAVKLLLRDFCSWLPTDWLITRQVLTRISKFAISRKISKIFWCRLQQSSLVNWEHSWFSLVRLPKEHVLLCSHWPDRDILDSHWTECQRNMQSWVLIGQTWTFLILIGQLMTQPSGRKRICRLYKIIHSRNILVIRSHLICKDDNSFQKLYLV